MATTTIELVEPDGTVSRRDATTDEDARSAHVAGECGPMCAICFHEASLMMGECASNGPYTPDIERTIECKVCSGTKVFDVTEDDGTKYEGRPYSDAESIIADGGRIARIFCGCCGVVYHENSVWFSK